MPFFSESPTETISSGFAIVAGAETRRSVLSGFFKEAGSVVCTFARTAGLSLCAVIGLYPLVGHGGTGRLEIGLYFFAGRSGLD